MNRNVFVFLMILLLILSGCTSKANEKIEESFFAMDTLISVAYYSQDNNLIIDDIKLLVQNIEEKMSRTIGSSEISQINEYAGQSAVKVSDETFGVVKQAVEYQKMSEGAFQITILPLVKLWDISSNDKTIPTIEEIAEAQKLADPSFLELDESDNSVYLKRSESGIDLGAIAKGYAADRVAILLKEKGIDHALVSAGGGILALGGKSDSVPWVIGLQNPLHPDKGHFALYRIFSGAVVTSGDYQRFKTVGGKKYHHLIDVQTGYPADSEIASVTIWADKSIDADALSTAVFVLGIDKGVALIQSIANTECMIVKHNKEVIITAALDGRIEIIDKEFVIDEIR